MDKKTDGDGGGEEGLKRYGLLESDHLQITGSHN